MKSSTRIAALALTAALSGAGADAGAGGPAEASIWSMFSSSGDPAPLSPTPDPAVRAASPLPPALDSPVGGSSGGTLPAQLAASARRLSDGSYTGPPADAYYGIVQVRARVHGGRLVSVDVLKYPSDRRTSQFINDQALPMLESEVVRAQSARVDTVSGATLTSEAYLQSVSVALRQAGG